MIAIDFELDTRKSKNQIFSWIQESESSLDALPEVGHCLLFYTYHISLRSC